MNKAVFNKESVSEYDLYKERKFFSCLNGVRCFSVVAVIWHHSGQSEIIHALKMGFLGVDMFFVLSGFLIVTLLLREKDKNNTISLKKFYIRRSLRIFPVYYAILLFLAIAYSLFRPNDPDTEVYFSTLPVYLLYLSNWTVVHAHNLSITWSLATEEQFYLIWPLLQKLFKPKYIYGVLGISIFINQLINFGIVGNLYHYFFQTEIPKLHILETTFTPILLGIVLAHLLHNRWMFSKLQYLFSHKQSSLASLVVLLLLVNYSPQDISGWPRLFIQIAMTIWLLSLVINEDNGLKKVFTNKLICRAGEISYGMYLYHKLTIQITRELVEKQIGSFPNSRFIICLVLTIIVSEISFRFFEKPFLNLKKYALS